MVFRYSLSTADSTFYFSARSSAIFRLNLLSAFQISALSSLFNVSTPQRSTSQLPISAVSFPRSASSLQPLNVNSSAPQLLHELFVVIRMLTARSCVDKSARHEEGDFRVNNFGCFLRAGLRRSGAI